MITACVPRRYLMLNPGRAGGDRGSAVSDKLPRRLRPMF